MGLTLLVHGTLMTLTLGGYWNLDTPARSAAAKPHHWQRKATIFGSQPFVSCAIEALLHCVHKRRYLGVGEALYVYRAGAA